jgi:outer membrane protein OmpA-like peptidoglycan-associated protein
MNDKIKKIIARSATALVAVSILAYIFWPESKQEEIVVQTTLPETTTTTTTVKIDESGCLVLFIKDSANLLMPETPCVNTYVDRNISGFYNKLEIICRSSGDGLKINRDQLSEKRAESLQFLLMKMGVNFESISSKAVSDSSPYGGVDPNTEEGKVLNRSCEINGLK